MERFLLENPIEVAFGTTRSIAGRCHATSPIVVRASRRLGYEGFVHLRSAVRQSLRKWDVRRSALAARPRLGRRSAFVKCARASTSQKARLMPISCGQAPRSKTCTAPDICGNQRSLSQRPPIGEFRRSEAKAVAQSALWKWRPNRSAQSLTPSRPSIAISVAVRRATSFGWPPLSANTSV